MEKWEVLQRIPIREYQYPDHKIDEYWGYESAKDSCNDDFVYYNNHVDSPPDNVKACYTEDIYRDMAKNGMQKFVAMIAGMLFMIDKGVVDNDLAYNTMWDINDFETGNYDDLFTERDLKLLKADIKTIKDYVEKHPELLEE